MDPTLEMLAEQVRSGNVLFVLGAGMGIDAKLPSSEQLAALICETATVQATSDLTLACDRFLGTGRHRTDLDVIVRDAIASAQRQADLTAYQHLARLSRVDRIVTTNYDTLLEDSFPIDSYDVLMTASDAGIPDRGKLRIYKIYGTIRQSSGLVLTGTDFADALDRMASLVHEIIAHLNRHYVVFVGFRGRDALWLNWLRELRYSWKSRSKPIFFVGPDADPADRGYLQELGTFHHIPLTASAFFAALTNASSVLAPRVGRRPPSRSAPATVTRSNPFGIWKTDQFLDDAEITRLFYDHPRVTGEIVGPGNRIIIGDRGTGKSMLLRALATKTIQHASVDSNPIESLPIYFKFDEEIQYETERLDDELIGAWRQYYQHTINLCLAESLVSTIRAVGSARQLVVPRVFLQFAENALHLSRRPAAKSLLDIENKIDDARQRIDRTNSAGPRTTPTTFATLVKHLRRNVTELSATRFVLLIDDFEGTADQFAPFARALKARRVEIKLATRAGAGAHVGEYETVLQKNEDYQLVDLDRVLLLGGTGQLYPSYVNEIIQRRLTEHQWPCSATALLPAGVTGEEKSYTGLANLIRLSSGQISKLLEICKDIVLDATASGPDDPCGAGGIPPRIQLRVVREQAAVHYSEVRSRHALLGPKVQAFVDSLGEYSRRRADGTSQRTLRFALRDPENLTQDDWLIFEHAMKAGVLQRATLRERQTDATVPRLDAYRLNRLLCPRYRISLADDHQRELTAEQVRLAVNDRDEFLIQLLSRKPHTKGRKSQQLDLLLPGESGVPEDERL